jgi:hypothetical protein
MENVIEKTRFEKELFNWDGMYLTYHGEHTGSKYYTEPCHPTRLGTPKHEFIARFKYGNYKPWKAWVNFLVKNATVEEYLRLEEETSPVGAMKALGYQGKT